MVRIAVEPEELQSMSTDFQQACNRLQEQVSRATGALGALEWAARSAMAIDGQVNLMRSQADGVIAQVQALARYLQSKAEAFAEADRGGAADVAAVAERAAGWVAQLPAVTEGHPGALAPAEPWMRIGSLLAPAVLPMAAGLWWLGGLNLGPPAPAAPASPNPGPSAVATQPAPEPAPAAPPPAPAPAPAIAPDVPMFSQQNGPWADLECRPETFATQGCLLTSIAMLVKHNKSEVTVDRDFMRQLRDGMCNENHDVVWDTSYLDRYGLTMHRQPVDDAGTMMQTVLANLRHQPPQPTIIGIHNAPLMHWLAITGYRGDGTELKPEDFTINDPYTSHGWSTLDQFLHSDKYGGGEIQQLVTITPAP